MRRLAYSIHLPRPPPDLPRRRLRQTSTRAAGLPPTGPLLTDTSGHRVYIAGWRFGPELWLPDFAPEAAIDARLQRRRPDDRRAAVRPARSPHGHPSCGDRGRASTSAPCSGTSSPQNPEPPHGQHALPCSSSTDAEGGHAARRSATPSAGPSARTTRRRWSSRTPTAGWRSSAASTSRCGRWDTPGAQAERRAGRRRPRHTRTPAGTTPTR